MGEEEGGGMSRGRLILMMTLVLATDVAYMPAILGAVSHHSVSTYSAMRSSLGMFSIFLMAIKYR
jgi:hypothetical protein